MNSGSHGCSTSSLLIEPTHWPQLGLKRQCIKLFTHNQQPKKCECKRNGRIWLIPRMLHAFEEHSQPMVPNGVCFALNYIKHIGAASRQHTWFQTCKRCQTSAETSSYSLSALGLWNKLGSPFGSSRSEWTTMECKLTVWLTQRCFVH